MLKQKKYSMYEWNEKIMPLVENGTLLQKPVKSEFLTIYQVFHGLLQDNNGMQWYCTGWQPPNGAPYVDVRKV